LEKPWPDRRAGKRGLINGDGTQRRDLTHVSDVARAVGLALRLQGTGSAVLNVGTGKNHSVMDMADAATKAAVRKFADILPAPIHQASHPADVPETLASLERVGLELGWAHRIFFLKSAGSTRCRGRNP
jgi:UDP-glucose 4-epimerase